MGWGRMLLLGNLGQQLDIQETQSAVRELEARLQRTGGLDPESGRLLQQLSREHHEMRLYYAALVRLLLAKGIIGHDELASLVYQIDGADGQTDGKLDGPLNP